MKPRVKAILAYMNLPRVLCSHAFGKEHTPAHRMVAGAILMVIGVAISKLPFFHDQAHFAYDLIGYMIHGLGTVPYAEHLLGE